MNGITALEGAHFYMLTHCPTDSMQCSFN